MSSTLRNPLGLFLWKNRTHQQGWRSPPVKILIKRRKRCCRTGGGNGETWKHSGYLLYIILSFFVPQTKNLSYLDFVKGWDIAIETPSLEHASQGFLHTDHISQKKLLQRIVLVGIGHVQFPGYFGQVSNLQNAQSPLLWVVQNRCRCHVVGVDAKECPGNAWIHQKKGRK